MLKNELIIVVGFFVFVSVKLISYQFEIIFEPYAFLVKSSNIRAHQIKKFKNIKLLIIIMLQY